jgi:hypothetical protein
MPDEPPPDDRPPARARPVRVRPRDDFDDDFDDRPRRRRRDEDDGDDPTGGLIPYKNGKALAAYYCAVFSLIPCVGTALGPAAVVLGVLGLGHAKRHPRAGGKAHAWIGIVLGTITGIIYVLGPIVVIAIALLNKPAR